MDAVSGKGLCAVAAGGIIEHFEAEKRQPRDSESFRMIRLLLQKKGMPGAVNSGRSKRKGSAVITVLQEASAFRTDS